MTKIPSKITYLTLVFLIACKPEYTPKENLLKELIQKSELILIIHGKELNQKDYWMQKSHPIIKDHDSIKWIYTDRKNFPSSYSANQPPRVEVFHQGALILSQTISLEPSENNHHAKVIEKVAYLIRKTTNQ